VMRGDAGANLELGNRVQNGSVLGGVSVLIGPELPVIASAANLLCQSPPMRSQFRV
jgi:hypothetical protein